MVSSGVTLRQRKDNGCEQGWVSRGTDDHGSVRKRLELKRVVGLQFCSPLLASEISKMSSQRVGSLNGALNTLILALGPAHMYTDILPRWSRKGFEMKLMGMPMMAGQEAEGERFILDEAQLHMALYEKIGLKDAKEE